MVPGLFSVFTSGQSAATCAIDAGGDSANEKPMAKSLPAVVFRDAAWYELERRAIFSKCWILATHASRFNKSGDFVAQTYAGFSYFIIKDKDGDFHAHHNVCRHRVRETAYYQAAGKAYTCALPIGFPCHKQRRR